MGLPHEFSLKQRIGPGATFRTKPSQGAWVLGSFQWSVGGKSEVIKSAGDKPKFKPYGTRNFCICSSSNPLISNYRGTQF